MGVVFLARHVATGAERAVKVVEVAGDPGVALRFLREAELQRLGPEMERVELDPRSGPARRDVEEERVVTVLAPMPR